MIEPELDISSRNNGKYKRVKRLLRERRFRTAERRFVVEGDRWLAELVAHQVEPELWVATPSWLDENAELSADLATLGRKALTIDPKLLKEITDTDTPPGALAVVPFPQIEWPSAPSAILVLDGVRDPGNLGTLIRSARAAGFEGIFIGPGAVDPYNPKVVRASMGGLLRCPIKQATWAELKTALGKCVLLGAKLEDSVDYTNFDMREPTAIVIGSEAHGIGDEVAPLLDHSIIIPMNDQTESLNAAVAGSILMFEVARQRRLA